MHQNPVKKFSQIFNINFILIIMIAFSFQQSVLYTSNQNTYLLHGLGESLYPGLKNDSLFQTKDPFPVFSELIRFTSQYLHPNFFYVYYWIIIGVFIYSVLEICCQVTELEGNKYLLFFVLFTIPFSGIFYSFFSKYPFFEPFAKLVSPTSGLVSGVAGQYILGQVFQPSVFGVFFLFSFLMFLKKKYLATAISLAIAPIFHSTYLLPAATVTLSYMFILAYKDKSFQKAIFLGGFMLILVFPVLFYNLKNFGTCDSVVSYQAQDILMNFRIPHHAKVDVWFSWKSVSKILLIAFSIYLVRDKRLFYILIFPYAIGSILSVFQYLTGNKFLALLFPWRISAILLPLAICIVLAKTISWFFLRCGNKNLKHSFLIEILLLIVISFFVFLGMKQNIILLKSSQVGVSSLTEYAKNNFKSDTVYLIPPEWETFRLAAGVPVLVDYKSHPYECHEVLEWYSRYNYVKNFYQSSSENLCQNLEDIIEQYRITNIVVPESMNLQNCAIGHEVFNKAGYLIFELDR